jgi:DNA polymerase III subunit gamma/tau
LPAPAELVRALANAPSPPSGERVAVRGQATERLPAPSPAQPFGLGPSLSRNAGEGIATASNAAPAVAPQPAPEPPPPSAAFDPMPQSFAEVVVLFEKRREALLRAQLWSQVHLVAFEPGRIEFRPEPGAPRDLANRLGQLLGEWTGRRWIVAVSQASGQPTLAEEEARRDGALRNEVAADPLVRAVLETFPGAMIAAVRERFAAPEAGAELAAEEAGDDLGDEAAGMGEDGS